VIFLGVLAVVAVPVGLLIAGMPGLTAALVGVVVAAIAGVTTPVAMLVGHTRPVEILAAIVAGSWLLKMIVIVVALLVLSGIEGFHRELFAAFVVVGVLGTLAVDVWLLQRARVSYVEPGSNSPDL
jgi:hypothetical protein